MIQLPQTRHKRKYDEYLNYDFDKLYEKMKMGSEINGKSRLAARDKDSHAVAVVFDEDGIPSLYDPGKKVRKELVPPVVDDRCITARELKDNVKEFAESLALIETIYTCDIEFGEVNYW